MNNKKAWTILSISAIIVILTLSFAGCARVKKTKIQSITVAVPKLYTCPGEKQNITGNKPSANLLSDSEFIYFAYVTVLNRKPDIGGFKFYCKALKTGMSRLQLINFFVASSGFKSSPPPSKAKH